MVRFLAQQLINKYNCHFLFVVQFWDKDFCHAISFNSVYRKSSSTERKSVNLSPTPLPFFILISTRSEYTVWEKYRNVAEKNNLKNLNYELAFKNPLYLPIQLGSSQGSPYQISHNISGLSAPLMRKAIKLK